MQHCVFPVSIHEEMHGSVSIPLSERMDPIVCPKPRRFGVLHTADNSHPVRFFRFHLSHQAELCDFKAGNDLLDVIQTEGGCGRGQLNTPVASSPPPFFCGSPPSRVANPLIHDARFGDEKLSPFSPVTQNQCSSGLSSSPTSSTRKGSCVRSNFGNKPSVRIEGFDCLDRDRRNCSIPALA
ncbi:hypothetical protein K2173_000234 [Erythroxylum novogranatense]|uniref:Uncharacterized protein n=1 Tax=Erythroxylum novogranatense TaxID=1862640 RepID=A0AAV8SWK9_9ROSI|nr:hypothetical protein K2173_000234 [Erythroxylum novogranatense]